MECDTTTTLSITVFTFHMKMSFHLTQEHHKWKLGSLEF